MMLAGVLFVCSNIVVPVCYADHIVQPGESVFLIAQQYGISQQELVEVNSIVDPEYIEVGQVLVIPQKEERVVPSSRGGRPDVVAIALQQVGKPYRWGGSGPNEFDCTGLVIYSFNAVGIPLNRDLNWMFSLPKADQIQRGDLVLFRDTYKSGISHVGIAVDSNSFVHAADVTYGVIVSSLSNPYWKSRFAGATRP
jgi:peptidoglycan endopeptidase LytE